MGTELWKEVFHDRQCQEGYLYLLSTFYRRKEHPDRMKSGIQVVFLV